MNTTAFPRCAAVAAAACLAFACSRPGTEAFAAEKPASPPAAASAGLPRIAPAGGPVAAILVLPAGSGRVRTLTANLAEPVLMIEPCPDVEWGAPPSAAGGAG